MKSTVLLLCFVLTSDAGISSRKRRYLVFPQGATFSAVFCMAAQTDVTPGEIFTQGINFGITYALPTDAKSLRSFKKPLARMRRTNRSDLYQKVEKILNWLGLNGRSCILRSLCESGQTLAPRGNNLVGEILGIVFRFPQRKLSSMEPEEHGIYHWAYRIGMEMEKGYCASLFANCSVSLIDLALGRVSL